MKQREYTDIQKEDMKDRLKKITQKKIQTTMIGAIHQFEMEFGSMWGYGKDEEALTKDEKYNRDKWERCRKLILDNGHRQKRGLMNELDMHTIVWNRYTMEFKKPAIIGD